MSASLAALTLVVAVFAPAAGAEDPPEVIQSPLVGLDDPTAPPDPTATSDSPETSGASAGSKGLGGVRLSESGKVVDLSGGADPLPDVSAISWVLADVETGEVLASKNAHKLRRPASTLKTLTALTVLPKLDPQTTWVGTAKAQNTYGSKVGVRVGLDYTVEELLYGLMLPSGNDAAIALAQANSSLAGTVKEMNDVARELQAVNTTVRNPSGLDAPGQFSTAYDLTLIARAALKRKDFRKYAGAKRAEFPNPQGPKKNGKDRKPIYIYNQNDLIMKDFKGAIGVKTGFTSKAGRTFIGAAERGGRTLVVALMGIKEPSAEAAGKLLNWGFENRDVIVPVGELVDPMGEQGSSVPEAQQDLPSTAAMSNVSLKNSAMPANQEPTLSSLSPTSWGWLAVFATAIALAVFAPIQWWIARKRRGFVF